MYEFTRTRPPRRSKQCNLSTLWFAYEFAKPFINGKSIGCWLRQCLWNCSDGRIRFWDYRFGLRWSDDWNKQESICIDPESEFSTCYNSSFANCGSVIRCDYIVPVHRTYSSRAEFIRECIRVLKPGGKVLITTPNNKMSLAQSISRCMNIPLMRWGRR